MASTVHHYTKGEEIWHAAIHGVGFMLSIVALILMVSKASSHDHEMAILATSLFGGGLMITFMTSTLYHSAFESPFQPFLKLLDHSAIYFTIATGYAPFALMVLTPEQGIPLLVTVLSMAVFGTVFKVLKYAFNKQDKFKWVSLTIYLAMGWAAVFLIKSLYNGLPTAGFYWLVAGGLSYTVGAVFYAMKSMKYSHAIWHFFVLLGAVCHFACVYWFVI